MSAIDQFVQEILSGIAGEVQSEGAFAEARKKAREGSPLSLARLQWPNSQWDAFQEEFLEHFFRTDIWACVCKGSTGCGKGATVARAVCLYYDVFRDAKVILTSVSIEHCLTTLFNEVKLWFQRMILRPPGLVGATMIKDGEEHFILPVNPANETAFAGKHSQGGHTLFVFDEACHDEKTEVLTRNGWKFFRDLDGSEEFLSMDIQTEQVEYLKAGIIHQSLYDGPMYCQQTGDLDFCVTPNHRMLYRSPESQTLQFQEARQLPVGPPPRTIPWGASERENYVVPELQTHLWHFPPREFAMDDWLECVAWYLAVGHETGSVWFTVKQVENLERLLSLLIRMGLQPLLSLWVDSSLSEDVLQRLTQTGVPPLKVNNARYFQIGLHSWQIAAHLGQIAGDGHFRREVPAFVGDCSRRQIELFLSVYGREAGESAGSLLPAGSKALADALQILVLKTGRACVLLQRNGTGSRKSTDSLTVSPYLLRVLSADEEPDSLDRMQIVPYTGTVYCVTLPRNGTLLTRRNGKVLWSGNSAVDPDRWDNMQDQANKFIAISNPRSPKCRFRKMFPSVNPDKTQVVPSPRGNIFCQTVSALDMRNYQKQCLSKPIGPIGGITIDGRRFEHGEKIPTEYYRKRLPIIPGQRCYDEVMADLSGRDKRRIEWQVHAKFPTSDDEIQVILPDWLEPHVTAWRQQQETLPVTVFGLDIAASLEGDCTCLAAGSALGCRGIHTTQKADTMQTIGWVYKIAREVYGIDLRQRGLLVGDAIGVGKGPLDALAAEGVEVLQVYAGGRPLFDSNRFINVRAEMYGLLGDRLDPNSEHRTPFPLPDDEKLLEELVAPEKEYDRRGKYRITPKSESRIDQGSGRRIESVKDKIGRSPDRADAVCLMYLGVRYLEGAGAPVIDRPLLLLSEVEMAEFEKRSKSLPLPSKLDPNLPPWLNPTSAELAKLIEEQAASERTALP